MTSALEDLREKISEHKGKRGRRRAFTEPTLDDFAYGAVLSFDQTLTKTGWSLVANEPGNSVTEPGLYIHAGGRLEAKAPAGLKGFEETFAKAAIMGEAIEEVVKAWQGVEAIVHEMPAVMGYRTESSLMAAREVRRANDQHPIWPCPIVMISRQQAYANLVGAPSIDKVHGTSRVNLLIPRERRNTTRWNQDVHDSVLLGLQYLWAKKRSEQ
jgi:hypothetical protein